MAQPSIVSLAIGSILRLAAISVVLGIVYLLGLSIFRLYFHPLSKYPGPFLARITDLYAGYHAWKGDIHVDMWRTHEKYGTHVRYSPNQLNINTATALKDIYSGTTNFQKSPNYRVLRHGPANTLTMVNKKEHARRRRIVSQGLSDAALRSHEPTLMAHIKKCFAFVSDTSADIHQLPSAEGWTSAKNMSNWFNWLTFDIMGDVVFGVQYDLLGSPTNRNIPEAIEQSNIRVSVLLQSPFLPQIFRIDRYLFPKAIEARNHFLTFVQGLVKKVMEPSADEVKSRTVVAGLRTATDPVTGGVLTAKEILAESTTLCVAGADTSSTALASTLFYLASNPRAYQRLQNEVRSTFSSVDEIQTGLKLSQIKYLKPCIDEALRMSPPAGSSLYREVQVGGATVDGETLPAGVQAGVPIYGIHHNAAYFPKPFEYRPERWIAGEEGATEKSVELARGGFCPFSIGMRSCVGKGMAMIELSLAVAYAMYTLDFVLGDENKDIKPWVAPTEFPTSDHITGSKSGPFLKFKRRLVE